MPPVPSDNLAAAIAECEQCRFRGLALCEVHDAAWQLETRLDSQPMAEDVRLVYSNVLDVAGGRDTLLGAFRSQLAALNLVWEAHQRGAIRLPASVADTVARARAETPDFLRGAPAGEARMSATA